MTATGDEGVGSSALSDDPLKVAHAIIGIETQHNDNNVRDKHITASSI
jgi:hypothetical protein